MPTLTEPDNSEVIKQRALRKEQARLHKQALADNANEARKRYRNTRRTKQQDMNQYDDKKAKIAAVIAKAKAKKLATEGSIKHGIF